METVHKNFEIFTLDSLYGILDIGEYRLLIGTLQSKEVGIYKGDRVFKTIKFQTYLLNKKSSYIKLEVPRNILRTKDIIDNFLKTASFYFTRKIDFSKNLKFDSLSSDKRDGGVIDQSTYRFNHTASLPFQIQNFSYFTDFYIMGFFEQFNVEEESSKKNDKNGKIYSISLIGRKSRFRPGVRFLARGIDSESKVGNQVESEMIFEKFENKKNSKIIFSFLQIRGSAPYFWHQKVTPLYWPTTIIPSKNKNTRFQASDAHLNELIKTYGRVAILSLLKNRGREKKMTTMMQKVMQVGKSDDKYEYIPFDLVNQAPNMHISEFQPMLSSLKEYMYSYTTQVYARDTNITQDFHTCYQFKNMVSRQDSIIRTNCKDSLDRTNIAQALVGLEVLKFWLKESIGIKVGIKKILVDFMKRIWVRHGNCIGQVYGGSDSLRSSFVLTYKWTFLDKLLDFNKLNIRWFKNHFLDQRRQLAISILSGVTPNIEISLGEVQEQDKKRHFFVRIFFKFVNFQYTIVTLIILLVVWGLFPYLVLIIRGLNHCLKTVL